MWNKGTTTVNGEKYTWQAKVYGEGSEIYGISGGRISKLVIVKDHEVLASYDRGWEFKPKTEGAQQVLEELLKRFN